MPPDMEAWDKQFSPLMAARVLNNPRVKEYCDAFEYRQLAPAGPKDAPTPKGARGKKKWAGSSRNGGTKKRRRRRRRRGRRGAGAKAKSTPDSTPSTEGAEQ